jgi:MmyB-like transcription regulator ligand binding domain
MRAPTRGLTTRGSIPLGFTRKRDRHDTRLQGAREFLHFRLTYDIWSHSPEFNEFVDELRTDSREFARWWKIHWVQPKPSGGKLMVHPTYGRVVLSYSTFQANDNPDLRLILYGGITAVNGR